MPRFFNREVPYPILGAVIGALLATILRERIVRDFYSTVDSMEGYRGTWEYQLDRLEMGMAGRSLTFALGFIGFFIGLLIERYCQQNPDGPPPAPHQ